MTTTEFADLADWQAWYESEAVQSTLAEMAFVAVNLETELWGPSPVVPQPIRPVDKPVPFLPASNAYAPDAGIVNLLSISNFWLTLSSDSMLVDTPTSPVFIYKYLALGTICHTQSTRGS